MLPDLSFVEIKVSLKVASINGAHNFNQTEYNLLINSFNLCLAKLLTRFHSDYYRGCIKLLEPQAYALINQGNKENTNLVTN